MVTTITNSGLANSSIIEPKETTVVVSGFGTGRTKDSKDKFTANGINNLKIVDSSNKIKQNGFSSFKVVPAIGTGSFDERFNVAFKGVNSTVIDALTSVQQDANNIKSTVLNMSNNLTTNYLSKAELTSYDNITNITSAIKEQTATFVTTEMAGGWYGLTLESDVKGKKYITGFDIGSLVYPEAGINDSFFRINADRFIVGGDIGDGEFGGPLDENGEPIPAFSIVQDGKGSPQMYFNGKVNIASMPESITKLIGKFAHISELNSYLAMHPEVVVRDGDSYLNTSENIVYFWDGDEWISAEGKLSYRSIVFKRSNTKPATPTGGNYSMNVPTGWSDGIPPHPPGWKIGTAVTPVWASYTEFDNKTDYTANPPVWTVPILTLDSATTDYIYHSSLTTPPTPTNTTDDTSIIQSDINNGWYNDARLDTVWAAVRHKQQGTWTDWEISKIRGENGKDGKDGNNGKDGIAGKDGVGIKSTTIVYGISDSESTQPTTWTSSVPSLVKGKYLWTKTVWTYSDSTSETGYTKTYIAKDGNNGTDGIAGKDGVGIKTTTITYGRSTSGTSNAGITWTSAVPSVPSGQYLWTKTVWTYSDNTTETGYSVAKMGDTGPQGPKGDRGADGIAGKDGVGIKSTVITYGLSTSDSTQPSTWTTTVPNLVKGQYLWTKTVWTYTDSTNETGYVKTYIAKDGNNGKDGIAGKDGVGIKSTNINYAASTSGTSAPTSGWSVNVPSVLPGQYLWTRTIWTYTDNTNETGYSVAKMGETGNNGKDGANGANGRRGSLVGRGSGSSWPSGSTLTNLIQNIPGSENRVYAGDTVIWTNTSTSGGTEIYEYNGSTWGTNTALKVNGNAVINGTLYSDRIVAGHIGSAVTALIRNMITATDNLPNENWTGGTTVGSISYTNHSSSYASILIIVTGRTGITGGSTDVGSCAFKIFDGTTQIYNYGWSPAWQDSKAFSTTVVMPPKSTRTFYVKAVKNASDASMYTLGTNMQISIIGVSNGG